MTYSPHTPTPGHPPCRTGGHARTARAGVGLGHRNTATGPALPVATLAELAALSTHHTSRGGGSPRVGGVFATCEKAFILLASGPGALSLDTRAFHDLPARRRTPLHLLRVHLAATGVSAATRAAVWAHLVTRARGTHPSGGPRAAAAVRWTVATAGMALPELLGITAAVSPRFRGDTADLEAATLGAFLAELRRPDLDQPTHAGTRHRLLTAAYRGARTVRETHPAHQPRPAHPSSPDEPGQPGDRATGSGHDATQAQR
jgi:hypothetical protein